MGGKNSVVNKPLGTGSNSVNAYGRKTIGSPLWDMGASYASLQTGSIRPAIESGKRSYQGAVKQTKEILGMNPPEVTGADAVSDAKVQSFLEAGRQRGETLVGTDSASIGKEREGIRQKYKDIVDGKSMVEKQMKQDLATRQKQARAAAAVGGQGQLTAAQQQAMGRQAASDIAEARNQEYMNALNKVEKQYRGAAGDIARLEGQYGSIAVGGQAAPQVQAQGGLTVICTELHKQGYLSDSMIKKDAEYGKFVRLNRPEVYIGYRFLADPVVRLMQKSKLFSKLVSIPAVKWAENMAGNYNFTGHAISKIGEAVCGFVGNYVIKYQLRGAL